MVWPRSPVPPPREGIRLDRPHPTPADPCLDPFALAKALSGFHFIGGGYVPGRNGKTFAVVNPATGIEVARAAEGDADDVDAAVQAASRAQKEWARSRPASAAPWCMPAPRC